MTNVLTPQGATILARPLTNRVQLRGASNVHKIPYSS